MSVYTGTVFGSEICLFHIVTGSDFTDFKRFLQRMALDKQLESIRSVFIVPDALITLSTLTSHQAYQADEANQFSWYTMPQSLLPATFNHTFTKKTTFTGFTPKNNKCFCYPYNYLLVTNNSGATNIYKYEDFSDASTCTFENQLSLSVGCSGRIVPKNYKGATYNYDEALTLGKYPTCAWTSDSYTNWLTQNSVNIAGGIAATAGLLALTIATGGAAAGVAAGATTASAGLGTLTAGKLVAGAAVAVSGATASKIGQFSEAKQLPNISGGQATGDVSFAADSTTFIFRAMRCKNEYMQIIDDYFTRFRLRYKAFSIAKFNGS